MAKWSRKKGYGRVHHYNRSFYSGGQLVKRILKIAAGIAALFLVGFFVAPALLDWGTHTWYTVVKNRDLSAASSASQPISASDALPAESEAASLPSAEPTATVPPADTIIEGSWSAVSLSALTTPEAAQKTAQGLAAQGVAYAIITLKDSSGYVYYPSKVELAAGSIAAATIDPAAVASAFTAAGVIPVANIYAFCDPLSVYTNRAMGIHYTGSDYMWLDNTADAGGKPWLNPYSGEAVQFIGDLIAEAQSFGFHHVLLSAVQFPSAVSAKQDFGDTQGLSRSACLAADVAVWQGRFDGAVTLWYEYGYAACAAPASITEVLPTGLGIQNLVVQMPAADSETDASALPEVVAALKAEGARYVVAREGASATFR